LEEKHMRKFVVKYKVYGSHSLLYEYVGGTSFSSRLEAEAFVSKYKKPDETAEIIEMMPVAEHLAAIDRAQEKINRAELSAMEASAASALS